MNDNQPPVQPDFGYIMNQPGASGEKPAKTRDTRVLIILGLLGLLAVMAIIAVVIQAANNKVNNSQLTKTETIQLQVKKYFGYISNNQTAEAYALLNDTPKQQATQDAFYENVVKVLNNNVDLSNCSFTDSPQTKNQSVVTTYACNTKDKKYKVHFTVQMTLVNNEYKIDAYDISSGAGA